MIIVHITKGAKKTIRAEKASLIYTIYHTILCIILYYTHINIIMNILLNARITQCMPIVRCFVRIRKTKIRWVIVLILYAYYINVMWTSHRIESKGCSGGTSMIIIDRKIYGLERQIYCSRTTNMLTEITIIYSQRVT